MNPQVTPLITPSPTTQPARTNEPETAPSLRSVAKLAGRGVRLGGRDELALRWCAEQYAVRVDVLERLLARWSDDEVLRRRGWLSPRSVEKVVRRWRDAGWADLEVLEAGRGARAWVIPVAAWSAGLARWRRGSLGSELRHLYWVAACRLYVEARHDGLLWTPERMLRGEVEGPGRRPHLPDGELTGDGWNAAVEVELTWKGAARTRGVLRDNLAVFDRVVYFPGEEVESRLRRLPEVRAELAVSQPDRRVEVIPISKVEAWLTRRG